MQPMNYRECSKSLLSFFLILGLAPSLTSSQIFKLMALKETETKRGMCLVYHGAEKSGLNSATAAQGICHSVAILMVPTKRDQISRLGEAATHLLLWSRMFGRLHR